MAFNEFLADAKLGIETVGRDESCADTMIMPYEPTPYCVLDRLCESGLITDRNHAVDYGSGKGRADILFFFNPFHFKTLKRVMKHVMESYERSPRLIRIFVYYPQNAYIAYLSSIPEAMFNDEIDCTNLFPEEDDRNRIMIFDIGQPSSVVYP